MLYSLILLFLILPGEPQHLIDAAGILAPGDYIRIKKGNDPSAKAIWAFAQYQLSPNKEVVIAAREAHEKGNLLGSFVIMTALREGMAIRHNFAEESQINYDLRQRLSAVENRSSLAAFILSKTRAGDRKGKMISKVEETMAKRSESANQRFQWLLESAEKGFAQGMDELGGKYQDAGSIEVAYSWYTKAAKSGLAYGLYNQGFLITNNLIKTDQTLEDGISLLRRGALAGNIWGMIGMATYSHRGFGMPIDQARTRKWLKRMADHHHLGAMEMSIALFNGHYGLEVDVVAANRYMERALANHDGATLLRLAEILAMGQLLKQDVPTAVRMAEAAWLQGNRAAPQMLLKIYSEGMGTVKKNKKRRGFWFLAAYNLFAEKDRKSSIYKKLQSIDPLTVMPGTLKPR